MTKRDTRKRRARARVAAKGAARAAEAGADTSATTASATPPSRYSGLEWLAMKNRISKRQRVAGELYGQRYRLEVMEGAESLRSCLEVMDRVDGGTGGGLPTSQHETLAWMIEGRKQLLTARAALGFHDGMILACDLICGRGQTPRELTQNQRDTEEIETTLRLALDLLAKHFEATGLIGGKPRAIPSETWRHEPAT